MTTQQCMAPCIPKLKILQIYNLAGQTSLWKGNCCKLLKITIDCNFWWLMSILAFKSSRLYVFPARVKFLSQRYWSGLYSALYIQHFRCRENWCLEYDQTFEQKLQYTIYKVGFANRNNFFTLGFKKPIWPYNHFGLP